MEMQRYMPWPFEDGQFPAELGAVVQRSVVDGMLPALVVGHAADGSWYVGDGVNDPNESGGAIATHMRHVIERNSSVADLAGLPPGQRAVRDAPGEPWRFEPADLDD
jgi:hypothetical protein